MLETCLITTPEVACRIGRALAVTFAVAGASQLFLIDLSQPGLAETGRLVGAASPSCSTCEHAADLTDSSISSVLDTILKVQQPSLHPLRVTPSSPAA